MKRHPFAVYGVAAAIVAATATFDIVSKEWARAHLASLLVVNPGASLGIGTGHRYWVLAISSGAVIALLGWLVRAAAPLERVGVALALGGGLGNLVDRIARGAVTDWIHVNGYPPTFNLADVAIRLGVLLALVALVRGRSARTPSTR